MARSHGARSTPRCSILAARSVSVRSVPTPQVGASTVTQPAPTGAASESLARVGNQSVAGSSLSTTAKVLAAAVPFNDVVE